MKNKTHNTLKFAQYVCLFLIIFILTVLATAKFSTHYSQNSENLVYVFPVQGWYLVSLPLTTEDNQVKNLFPLAMGAFAFDPERFEYFPVDTMTTGQGYFLAVREPGAAVINGEMLDQFTNHYHQGWHLIGSVIDSVDFKEPSDDPDGSVLTPLFAWDDIRQQYYATTTIEQAYGHWIAVMQECDVMVNNNVQPSISKALPGAIKENFVQKYGSGPPPPPFLLQPELAGLFPTKSHLIGNYPNPLNGRTAIRFTLENGADIKLEIFNLLGQPIRTLLDEHVPCGTHEITWDGIDQFGQMSPSGIYFYRLTSDDFSEVRKMILAQ